MNFTKQITEDRVYTAGILTVIVAILAILFSGCASVKPGNDPLVVRTEQLETTAKATFVLTLRLDQANRSFWATNAPAYHRFCEKLRKPAKYLDKTLPAYRVYLLKLDDAKLQYQFIKSQTNALAATLATVEGLVAEANAWNTIVKGQ